MDWIRMAYIKESLASMSFIILRRRERSFILLDEIQGQPKKSNR